MKKNPGADILLTVEWLSRTKFGQLVGQKFANEKEKVMLAKHKSRKAVFEACRENMINPETGKPLTAEDRQGRPWLFIDREMAPKRKRIMIPLI